MLDLFGTIEWFVNEFENGKRPSQPSLNELARDRGTSYAAIRRNVTLLQSAGWLNFITIDNTGTEWTLHGVPTTNAVLVAQATDAMTVGGTYAMTVDPTIVTTVDPTNAALVHQEVLQESLQETNQEAPATKKNNQNHHLSESKLKEELILKWNEGKPKAWKKLGSLSPSRCRSIRALGGYRVVIDQLPAFFTGAKHNKFWATKEISWENVIGSGMTPKAHFTSLAEDGAGSNSNTTPRSLEHPDFFPPIDAWSELRPKHGKFSSDEDRDAREAEARKFYQQEATK